MPEGLSLEQVAERQLQLGPNALPTPKYRFIKLLARQCGGVFNILLIIAAAVTFFLGEIIDGSFILIFLVIGIGLSLFQEFKSNAAVDILKSYLVRTVTVRRAGKEFEIPTHELVPGDIIKLEQGDIVPADAVVREAHGLLVDETTFTGESISVAKSAVQGTSTDPEHTLFQGVVIVQGTASAEVTAIGTSTKLAKIAAATSSVQAEGGFTKDIDRISVFILRATLLTLLFMVIANVLIDGTGTDIPGLLIFSIALAVSVIPEALPLVMTFSLSRGALRLAEKHVIVKRLSSVQDLGSIELLCTDKTGTITENRLVYKNDYIINESRFHPLVLASLTANDLVERNPEPFDRAATEALSVDQRNEVGTYTLIEEEAFDPKLRSNGAIVRRTDGLTLHIRRGSPEYFLTQGLVARERVNAWLLDEEMHGHRVLGVSYDEGDGPRFGGFVSFADTLKETTAATILAAEKLNVAITIITGDAIHVAESVAREIGLVVDTSQVIDAGAFLELPHIEQRERVGDIRVFARTTPEQKLEILELLKEKFTVGFLGEGINDAPALKAAHVSMVVPSASDVARETADIILLQTDLGVIVEGIKLGRETHVNTLKYIRATLVSNFGNFYAVAIGSLFITFLPMLPKQLLLLNLLSDFPMMLIAFDRVGSKEIAKPQRYDFRSLYIIFVTLGLVSTVFDFIYFALFYHISPEVLHTNWFIASVLTEILLLISIRSMLPIEKAGRPAPIIIGLSVVAFCITIALPMIPSTAAFFEFTPPSLAHITIIIALAATYLAVSELVKRPLVRFLEKSSVSSATLTGRVAR